MRLVYRFSRQTVFWWALGFFRERTFSVKRVPREGPVLLAANHQSFLDPILVTCVLPRECHYMARDTLFRNSAFARVLRLYNTFPIKRGAADLSAIRETLRRLKGGALVVTFPEGTRTSDGAVHPFQPGVITLARRARVPVVPAAIEGAWEAWPRQSKLPRMRPVWVEYGAPLSVGELVEGDTTTVAEQLTRRVRALHNRLRERCGRPPIDYGDQ